MIEDRKTARVRFAAALALYLLWVAALVVLAVLSALRPAVNKTSEKGLASIRKTQAATSPWVDRSRRPAPGRREAPLRT